MKEGDSYTFVLTVNGTLTSKLKEVLEQEYPDNNSINGIQNMVMDTFRDGNLKILHAKPYVSFTSLKERE